ncbi:MAG TPA: response regulator [Phototrophicaceae bacterium]|nr:response regulator [Phototrophicaceae bacterium]
MAKILVVEDTHSLRKDIVEMLSFEGYEVRGAEDGLAGIKAAQEFIPDLIVCDILMPGMDGYGMLAELKKDSALTTIPFIFLTAKADKSDMRKGMELGAYDYLTKPFSASELIAAVHTQLQKRKIITEITEKRLEDLRENIILALPHEIRTPLTSILGFSDIIASDSNYREPEQIVEMAQYINDAGSRLYRLTENYLAYAQLEAMNSNPDWAKALLAYNTPDPQVLIQHTAEQKAQDMQRDQDLQLQLEEAPTVQVLPDHLKKIVEELLDNAFKFSHWGTPVKVETTIKGSKYHLQITDQGRGMSADQIKAVGAYMQFGRKWFEQQGLGLGLIITRRLSELYGGETSIESVPEQYTKVTVTLPLV